MSQIPAGGAGVPPPPPSPQLSYAPQPPPSSMISAAGNGIGTAGGVTGIVGIALFWLPFIGVILGVIAVSLSGVGLQRANRMTGMPAKGMAITGIVCGSVALAIGLLYLGLVFIR
ncbi:MAG: hypothetical protein ACRDOD_15390 [Streptosporangiaceae bacterium]